MVDLEEPNFSVGCLWQAHGKVFGVVSFSLSTQNDKFDNLTSKAIITRRHS